MRYFGFAARDYLVLERLPINKNLSFLEIGVGLGGVAEKVIGRVRSYCGVDVDHEAINYLLSIYKNVDSTSWWCLDACKVQSSLGEKFDIIFSAHALEHVESPQGFFNFIKRHLKPDGIVLITFPNESKDKHHGITWFDNKRDLLSIIDKEGFQIVNLWEIKNTLWHKIVKKCLWEFPKLMMPNNKALPQTFSQTEAFRIVRTDNILTKIFALYARMVTGLAAIFPLHKYKDIDENIVNKNLFIFLNHKEMN